MKRPRVEQIANAVLYEGYMLYPYTASSLKNQKRWNFGVLSPRGVDTDEMRTECLVDADPGCEIETRVRFLWYADTDGDEPDEREIDLRGLNAAKSVPLPNHGRACGGGGGGGTSRREACSAAGRMCAQRNDVRRRGRDAGQSMLSTHTILTVRARPVLSR